MQTLRPNNLQRNRYADYVEAVSKHSGGKVEFFECLIVRQYLMPLLQRSWRSTPALRMQESVRSGLENR
jgi:hypothetical protein